MELSSSTVFLIVLGVFVAFCMFSHVKRRYVEGLSNDDDSVDSDTLQYASVDTQTIDRPDYKECKGMEDPRKCKKKTPEYMMPENKVKIVEGFGQSDYSGFEITMFGAAGKPYRCTDLKGNVTESAYGCCPDYTAMADSKGSNCPKGYSSESRGATGGYGNYYTSYNTVNNTTNSSKSDESSYNPRGNWDYHRRDSDDDVRSNLIGNSSDYPAPLPQTCEGSMHGCCPDGMTSRNRDGSNCAASKDAEDSTSEPAAVEPDDMYPGVTPSKTSTVLIPPPVGNAGGSANNCPAPPPCPACERCPEPAFECKKVLNYNSQQSKRVAPQALLSDFSTFGT